MCLPLLLTFKPGGEITSNCLIKSIFGCRYLNGASIGEEIVIESKAVKTGKTMAYLEVFIKNKESGQLLVSAVLTRYLIGPKE